MQSQNGVIEFLPALPSAWPTGSVKGLRARGGFEISLAWNNGKLQSAEIKSINGTQCNIRYGDKTASLSLKRGQVVHLNSDFTKSN
jgi:alpha-L-fucosidase 2